MTRKFEINENRNFLGVWIPAELYTNTELSWDEKILLIEINSLSRNGECFATNQHFANFIGMARSTVEKKISRLIKLGYVTSEIIFKNGSYQVEKRILRVVDPLGYTTQVPYLQNGREVSPNQEGGPISETGDTPISEQGKQKYNNTLSDTNSFNNTKEEYTHLDNLESDFQENHSGDGATDKLVINKGKWEWRSPKQYKDYIEKILPEFISEISSKYGDPKSAYDVFLGIFQEYFEYYRINVGKLHPWYRKELIEEIIKKLFKDYNGLLDKNVVVADIEQFFTHENFKGYEMCVFANVDMNPWIQMESNDDFSEIL